MLNTPHVIIKQNSKRNKGLTKQGQLIPRINKQIKVPQVRLVSEEGEQLGIAIIIDAQRKAKTLGLDLVEISPNAKPPVCKITEIGKYRYDLQKKSSNDTIWKKKGSNDTIWKNKSL